MKNLDLNLFANTNTPSFHVNLRRNPPDAEFCVTFLEKKKDMSQLFLPMMEINSNQN